MKLQFNKHLFIARHGQTKWNIEHRYQGREDSPLTDEGKRECVELGKTLKKYNIEIIVSSPIKRAFDSAFLISKKLGIKQVMTMSEFKERDYGVFEGKTIEYLHSKYPNIHLTHSWKTAPSGAEQLSHLEERVIKGLKRVKELYYPENVLIITHAGAMRMIIKYFENISKKNIFDHPLAKNCEFYNY